MAIEIICTGFGGQGVLTTGLIISSAGHKNGKRITWYPSYGSEMRGGTANCNVKISDIEIGNPYCNKLDILIAMNEPSIDRFEKNMKQGGNMFVNGDMVSKEKIYREDIKTIIVPANKLAEESNNPKGANIVMLGAMVRKTQIFEKRNFLAIMCEYFEDRGKGKYNKYNIDAFEAGYNAVR